MVFACSEAVAVHTTDTGVPRVDAVATGDLADGLADLTESLDPLCNRAHRLFCRERVDLGLGARDIEVGQDQDIVQCNAVTAVRELKDVTEHQCVLGDLALDGCFHCFSTREVVGYRTDTTDTGRDLGDLLGGLTYGKFLNAPHRGNGTPVTRLDDACVVNLQDQLGVSLMSCGWGMATYVLLTGASPSIVRAGVAGILGLLAVLASRPSDGWLLWLAPAAWLLTVNPNNLFDVSFQLSFAAVAGLLLLARPLTRALSFLPGPLPEQVGVTTAASISTAPVSVLTFGSASLVSVPANAVGGFVLGPIMFLGMLSLLAGFVSEWLSRPLNLMAGLFIGFLLEVAQFFAGLPGATYTYQGVTPRLLLVAGLGVELIAVSVLALRAGGGPVVVRPRPPPVAAAGGCDRGRGRGGAAARPGAGAAAGHADVHVPGRRRGGGRSAPGAGRAHRAGRRRAVPAGGGAAPPRGPEHRPAGGVPRTRRPRGRAGGRGRQREYRHGGAAAAARAVRGAGPARRSS